MNYTEFETELTLDKLKEIVVQSFQVKPTQVISSNIELTPYNTIKVTAQLSLESPKYFVES
jgi:hypothetical protein